MLRVAIKTLLFNRGKLLVAVVGVVFSLVLVNIQGGLFLGMIRKASLLVDNCDADIWVAHRGIHCADAAATIPEGWLDRIRGMPGVHHAVPYIVATAVMTLSDGNYEGVWIVGSDPEHMIGTAWSFAEGSADDLRQPKAITVDRLDEWKLGHPNVGDLVEISGRRARIAAKTNGILGFVTAPYVFTSIDNARAYCRLTDQEVSFYLIKASDETNVMELCERIRERVPDLRVFRAEEFSYQSQLYWATRTGLGMSFGGAASLGVIVGLVMVAQSLYAIVLDHLEDYATLKAIGANESQLYCIVIIQGVALGVIGSATGLAIFYFIKSYGSTPYAEIATSPWLTWGGIALVFVICLFSAILPMRKIRCANPVSVLQA